MAVTLDVVTGTDRAEAEEQGPAQLRRVPPVALARRLDTASSTWTASTRASGRGAVAIYRSYTGLIEAPVNGRPP